MARQPEAKFYSSINALIPSSIYKEKMHNVYSGGTPDVWYSGIFSDLWVEYKWIAQTPTRAFTPNLSALQLKWIKGRSAEGRTIAVIVGCPDGGYILDDPSQWGVQIECSTVRLYSKKEIAEWITNVCT